MSVDRLHLPDRHALEVLRQTSAWAFIAALVTMLRNALGALSHRLPEPDTSIAWEDGELHDDSEVHG